MNNDNNNLKRFVVCKQTLKELYNMYMSDVEQAIWKWENTTASEEEKEKAKQSNYYVCCRVDNVSPYDRGTEGIVHKKGMEIFLSGYADDIVEKIKEEVRKSEIKYTVRITKREDGDTVSLEEEYVDCVEQYHPVDAIEDNAELEKELCETRVVPYSYYRHQNQDKLVMLSVEFKTGGCIYRAKEDLDTILSRKIRAFIKKELTYCIKQNKNIVPKEYLDKGEAGIKEWQALKQSQNKNNSMEKKLIISSVRQKKDFLHSCNDSVMRTLTNTNVGWGKPRLDVDGLWNKTRAKKLETEMLGNKSKQEIIMTGDKELYEMCKNYWKDQLTQAIKRIDELSFGGTK